MEKYIGNFIHKLDYKSLFDYNPDAILTLDSYGTIKQANQSASKILGYTTEELLNNSYEIILQPENVKQVQGFFAQVIQGTAQEYEAIAIYKDLRLINLWVKTIPIVIDGTVAGAYWIAKDITAIKNAVDELYKTEKKLEEFFNHTADVINVLDLHGNIIQINPAFETMYGWKENEILGAPLPNLPPERITEVQELIDKIKRGEIIKGFETTRITKEGSYIDISLTYSPINDLNGNLVAIAGIGRDITEKKRHEEKLEFLAFHDPLTRLPNRRLFLEILHESIS